MPAPRPRQPDQQLALRLAAETDEQRARVLVDTVLVDTLVRAGHPAAAAAAVDEHRAALAGYAERLRAAIAEATAGPPPAPAPRRRARRRR